MVSDAQPPRRRRAALAGIALMVAGIFLFAVNDTLGKWLVATYSVGQVLLVRSLAALALLAPFIWRDRASFAAAPRRGLQALRAVFATVEVACFYWAVAYLPLADVMAYYLAGPIFVTAIAGRGAARAGRLAALERGAGGLCRRRDLPAARRRHAELAGADRARRLVHLLAVDDRDALSARHRRHRAGDDADRGRARRSARSRRRSPG